ncbi:hypothetical protein MVES1_000379 [Malassezia vespertilionis]|uniref:Acyltransferase MbtK/IucB-like conserved domain-containing protein n=1 Tax=Malassezia vespertilionis TaxID=2020962 RepID=A0A2N1JH49_9BASI|nr:uncharacterized protein MVES1_000379 [Malassezia vespertilionis]PKI85876.1 hypothetical protein MVES_000359 [Malassezia vespertilionis]WFD05054.1 hypothetical protein MVES1_000379 [Malassezia vespertilionis]
MPSCGTAKRSAHPVSETQKMKLKIDEVAITIDVKRDAVQQRERGPLQIVQLASSDDGAAKYVVPDAAMHVTPRLPPYTHSSQEPDDNTLGARAKRFARVLMSGASLDVVQLWAFVYAYFSLWHDHEYFILDAAQSSDAQTWLAPLLRSGLALPHPDDVRSASYNTLLVSRAAFWQGAGPVPCGGWVPILESQGYPFLPTTNRNVPEGLALGTLHPARAPKIGAWDAAQEAVVYRRYIPELEQTLTFRHASSKSEKDVDLLHRWHADDRVKTGWRQDMPRDAHKKYLADQEATGDSIALIGAWDGEPFGYIEVYYPKETPLRNYFDAGDYDRGFHALVGEDRFRGPHRVRSWMGSVIHFLFLLDNRTMRVVSEPRASNTKMVEYECMCGGHVEKWIDLPHKRAALVYVPRERYFQLCPMGPLRETASEVK